MAIMNYTTTIGVQKTAAEIQILLSKSGANRISQGFDDKGNLNSLWFTLIAEYGPREYELPVRAEGVLAALKADRNVPRPKAVPEQAERVAWRIAKNWLEAQLALIEASMATLDEVMMPYMLDAEGVTLYRVMVANQLSLEGRG